MMKLIIDIPKEFESDYNGDLFKDFFSRVLCDIQQNGTICGNYEKEIAEMFLKAFDESKKMDNNGWIPCSERLPEERDSMFAKLKGTDKWSEAMFEKISDDVNVTVEFEDGTRKTMTLHTNDGKWNTNNRIVKFNVIAWQLLPEPYKESDTNGKN